MIFGWKSKTWMGCKMSVIEGEYNKMESDSGEYNKGEIGNLESNWVKGVRGNIIRECCKMVCSKVKGSKRELDKGKEKIVIENECCGIG